MQKPTIKPNTMTTATQGHIYIKINEYFTATIKSISDLKRILSDENEPKGILEITEVSNVSKKFKKEIKRLIEDYKNPIIRTELYRYDRKGNIIGKSTFALKFHQNGQITILDGYAEFSPTRKQTIKNGTHGQYLTNVASGSVKWYLD